MEKRRKEQEYVRNITASVIFIVIYSGADWAGRTAGNFRLARWNIYRIGPGRYFTRPLNTDVVFYDPYYKYGYSLNQKISRPIHKVFRIMYFVGSRVHDAYRNLGNPSSPEKFPWIFHHGQVF